MGAEQAGSERAAARVVALSFADLCGREAAGLGAGTRMVGARRDVASNHRSPVASVSARGRAVRLFALTHPDPPVARVWRARPLASRRALLPHLRSHAGLLGPDPRRTLFPA